MDKHHGRHTAHRQRTHLQTKDTTSGREVDFSRELELGPTQRQLCNAAGRRKRQPSGVVRWASPERLQLYDVACRMLRADREVMLRQRLGGVSSRLL